MLLQCLSIQLLLILFWIDVCVGQRLLWCSFVTKRETLSSNINHDKRLSSDCITPDKSRGNCKLWKQCEVLSNKFKGWHDLKPYLCGFPIFEPMVCCPSPPLPNTSGFPDSSNAKPIFLPDDCGSSIFMHNRIIGGQKSKKGIWPWMAVILRVIRNTKSVGCGAALVTARHVITAAHCVVKPRTNILLDPKRLMVRVGAHDLSNSNDPDAMDVGVDEIRIHERYDLRLHTDDIAVIRLSEPVPFNNHTAPVCLPYDSLRDEDLSGKNSTVTGFGMTSVNGSASEVLLEVSFGIQDQEECRKTYERHNLRIMKVHLCAGTLDGSKDACQGDSGGPLVTTGKDERYYLIGIVSFGTDCAQEGYPGVYTRVTEYLDWLRTRLAD